MDYRIWNQLKKLLILISITLAILAIGALLSDFTNYNQDNEIRELKSRVNQLESHG